MVNYNIKWVKEWDKEKLIFRILEGICDFIEMIYYGLYTFWIIVTAIIFIFYSLYQFVVAVNQ